jgi:hypothetical protein
MVVSRKFRVIDPLGGVVENLHPGWWNSFSLKGQEYRRHRRGCGGWG